MSENRGRSSLRHILVAVISIRLHSHQGVADDLSAPKNGTAIDKHAKSGGSTGVEVLGIFLAVIAIVVLSIFLFKMWQKKKREEQHARLLRLFEEDDELELELGLHD
ncbi:hypothetical protein QJS04_geneDACA016245 [Acorus gramineus]|uniref:Uncharacterized protein n=1 Tax=Acorus gramineus TaxID=55184 RepID=A0AAV9AHA8_ACOGR|nr:hypothetical protein QJS04_geneDACA016245 [Acorus gramineus]